MQWSTRLCTLVSANTVASLKTGLTSDIPCLSRYRQTRPVTISNVGFRSDQFVDRWRHAHAESDSQECDILAVGKPEFERSVR